MQVVKWHSVDVSKSRCTDYWDLALEFVFLICVGEAVMTVAYELPVNCVAIIIDINLYPIWM